MTHAYYNEHDEFAADWLRNLITAGLIADGEVDTRSIVDVRPDDLRGFGQCHFFAGIGGWSYALRRAGWSDSSPVWTGSCPCQPFSLAGAQRGFADERHLWPVWRDLIRKCGPAIVFGEQVASATDWLGLVRGDLEEMGRAVGAMPIQAASAGADHLRDRYWFVGDMGNAGRAGLALRSIAEVERGDLRGQGPASPAPSHRGDAVADANGIRSDKIYPDSRGRVDGDCAEQGAGPSCSCDGDVADAGSRQCAGPSEGQSEQPGRTEAERSGNLDWVIGADGKARRVKSGIRLLAHGVPNRVGLLRGFGNAIDPRPAAAFIEAYMTARRYPSLTSQNQSVSQTVQRGVE